MTKEEKLCFIYQLLDSYRKNFQYPDKINLKSPLQLTIIWFKSQKNDFQIFLVNHSDNLPDKSIDIFGPYNASKKNVLLDLETDLMNGIIFRLYKDRKDEVKTLLEKLIRKNYPYLKKEPQLRIIKDGIFFLKNYYLIYHGNIFENSYKTIINFFQVREEESKRFDDFIQKMESVGMKKISKEDHRIKDIPKELLPIGDLTMENDAMPILGGYIMPPAWFGDVPKPSIEDRLKGKHLSNYIKTIKHEEISGRRIILKNDGYLGISINTNIDGKHEFKEEEETYKFINFFLGIFLINEIEVYSIHESEFFYTLYLPEKDLIDETHHGYSRKSRELFDVKHQPLELRHFHIKRNIISLSKIETAFRTLKSLIGNNQLFNSLSLLIDSFTHLLKFELNESFILSWVLIEQYLNYVWNYLLDSKNISNKRKEKLNGREFTAHVKINILALLGILEEEEYRDVNKMRKNRNELMHEIEFINIEDAGSAYKLALTYVKKRVSNYLLKENKG